MKTKLQILLEKARKTGEDSSEWNNLNAFYYHGTFSSKKNFIDRAIRYGWDVGTVNMWTNRDTRQKYKNKKRNSWERY